MLGAKFAQHFCETEDCINWLAIGASQMADGVEGSVYQRVCIDKKKCVSHARQANKLVQKKQHSRLVASKPAVLS
ncbi:MAG: hypothetical protein PCFJNLEI_01572 [Verrucomicrobiae bacterium]|nr:hypothetical protein [Verrucomicrobiae bacterium]